MERKTLSNAAMPLARHFAAANKLDPASLQATDRYKFNRNSGNFSKIVATT